MGMHAAGNSLGSRCPKRRPPELSGGRADLPSARRCSLRADPRELNAAATPFAESPCPFQDNGFDFPRGFPLAPNKGVIIGISNMNKGVIIKTHCINMVVIPEICKGFRRRISAATYAWATFSAFVCVCVFLLSVCALAFALRVFLGVGCASQGLDSFPRKQIDGDGYRDKLPVLLSALASLCPLHSPPCSAGAQTMPSPPVPFSAAHVPSKQLGKIGALFRHSRLTLQASPWIHQKPPASLGVYIWIYGPNGAVTPRVP